MLDGLPIWCANRSGIRLRSETKPIPCASHAIVQVAERPLWRALPAHNLQIEVHAPLRPSDRARLEYRCRQPLCETDCDTRVPRASTPSRTAAAARKLRTAPVSVRIRRQYEDLP